jgi:chromosome segregation ATPase
LSSPRPATPITRHGKRATGNSARISGRDYEDLARKLRYVKNDSSAAYDRRGDLNRKLDRIEAEIKREQADKNRVTNAETDKAEARREKERKELRESLRHLNERLADLRASEFRHEQQMQQIKRDIYRD